MLVLAAVILLLVVALEPAHRRARRGGTAPFPRSDRRDRDRERVDAEHRVLSTSKPGATGQEP